MSKPWPTEEELRGGTSGASGEQGAGAMERQSVVPFHISGSDRAMRLGAKVRAKEAGVARAGAPARKARGF